MSAFRIASILRYVAVPLAALAALALWSWLKPIQFPSWVFTTSLLLNSCILVISLIFHIPGSKR
jgi:hypothetical protein